MATATEKWSQSRLRKGIDTWTASREFHVIDATSRSDAIDAVAISLNDAHPESDRLKCDSLEADLEGFNLYRVRVGYSIPSDGENHTGAGADTDPLSQPPRIRWFRIRESVPFEKDRDGNPVVNSAKVPFDPPPQKLTGRVGFVVTRWEPFFNVQTSNNFVFTVNSNAFTILGSGVVDSGQVLCVDIAPTDEYTDEAEYVEVAYEFWLSSTGHGLALLDQGDSYLPSGSNASRVKFTDSTGDPLSEPKLLDGTGAPYDDASITGAGTPNGATADDTGYAVFLTYQPYPAKDFSELNL